MKKGFIYALVFVASIAISAVYQSCGKSSIKANSSDNDGLQIDIDLDNVADGNSGDESETPTCSEDEKQLSLNCGDNIFYVTTSQATERVATVRVLLKPYYVMMETHVYEAPSVNIVSDLPNSYCANSALPHCAHLNNFVCQGFGCFEGPEPVRCHWQKRMTNAQQSTAFTAIEEIRYVNRVVDNENPFVNGCNDPILSFHKENSTVDVSLAPQACVPDGDTYANGTSGEGARTIFSGEILNIESLQEMDDTPEFCNNFSAYSYDTTRFTYDSISGFVPSDQSYSYHAEYEALPVPDDEEGNMYGAIDLRWRIGTGQELCVFDYPFNGPPDYEPFFPNSGLIYEVFRPSAVVSNLPSATITYTDPADGGAEWKFFLNRGSAMLVNGGAVIEDTQAAAIRNMIENVIIPAATPFGQACP